MQAVLRLVESAGSASVSELAKSFAVSEVTVRGDLSELAHQGLVTRVRGGVRARERRGLELAFDQRLRIESARKQAIARAAATLIDDGEAVALDSSTTSYYLALELRDKHELVVVTNGLFTAAALADAPGVTVLMTGGIVRMPSMSVVGDLGSEVLQTTQIDKGFLGARGLSLQRGLMDLDPSEVRVKREIADACGQVFGILDSTKWQRNALLSFVGTDAVDAIVTDADAPSEEVEAWRERGVAVTLVDIATFRAPAARTPELRRPVPDHPVADQESAR